MIIEQKIFAEEGSEAVAHCVSSEEVIYDIFSRMADEDKDIILSDYELDRENKRVKLSFQFVKVKSIEGTVFHQNDKIERLSDQN